MTELGLTLTEHRWCLTIHSPPETWKEKLSGWKDWTSYGVVSMEQGEGGVTPHLQGYVECEPRKRLTWLNKAVLEGGLPPAHWERAKGTGAQNKIYCLKEEGDSLEWGELSGGQGKRKDLDALREMAANGASFLEMAEAYPSSHARTHKWCSKISMEVQKLKRHKAMKEAFQAVDLVLCTCPLRSLPMCWG